MRRGPVWLTIGHMKQLNPRWIALVAITAIACYVVWLIFSPFLNVLLWSMVLTVIASPLNNALRKVGRAPNVAALITVLVVIFVVLIPAFFIVTTAADHADEAVAAVQQGYAKLTDPASRHYQFIEQYVDLNTLLQKENIQQRITTLGGEITTQSWSLLSYGFITVVETLLVLFTTFYMLRDGGTLLGGVRALLPLAPEQSDAMIARVRTIISASLKGTMLIALIQGTIGGIVFWILGLPAALLWGLVMILASLIPVVGSSIIWVPAAIYLLSTGWPGKAIALVVCGIGISMVDNLLRPTLVGSKTRMHELTVFFAVLGGIQLFGPVGLIAGPIFVALAAGMVQIFFATAKVKDEEEVEKMER